MLHEVYWIKFKPD